MPCSLRIKAITIGGCLTVMSLKHILPTPVLSPPLASPFSPLSSPHSAPPLLLVPLRAALLGRRKSDQNCRRQLPIFNGFNKGHLNDFPN